MINIMTTMVQIYENFPSMNKKEFCQCENEITIKHIYDCEYFCENKEIEKPNFKQIFQENVREQMIISRIFEQNYEKSKRRKEETQTLVISHKEPLCYACNSIVMEQFKKKSGAFDYITNTLTTKSEVVSRSSHFFRSLETLLFCTYFMR